MSLVFSRYSGEEGSTAVGMTEMEEDWWGVVKVATVLLLHRGVLGDEGWGVGRRRRGRRHWRLNCRDTWGSMLATGRSCDDVGDGGIVLLRKKEQPRKQNRCKKIVRIGVRDREQSETKTRLSGLPRPWADTEPTISITDVLRLVNPPRNQVVPGRWAYHNRPGRLRPWKAELNRTPAFAISGCPHACRGVARPWHLDGRVSQGEVTRELPVFLNFFLPHLAGCRTYSSSLALNLLKASPQWQPLPHPARCCAQQPPEPSSQFPAASLAVCPKPTSVAPP